LQRSLTAAPIGLVPRSRLLDPNFPVARQPESLEPDRLGARNMSEGWRTN